MGQSFVQEVRDPEVGRRGGEVGLDGGDGVRCYGAELAEGGIFKGGEGGKEGGIWAEEFGECYTVEVN